MDKKTHYRLTGMVPISIRSRLLLIRVDHPNMTIQDLMVEAMDLLFAKYGVPPVEPAPKSESRSNPGCRSRGGEPPLPPAPDKS